MTSAKKNYIYNIVYQLLLFIVPIITTPYLSRTIGVNGVGIYSFTYSIVYYFMLFTLLGISNYASRTIAKVRDSKEKLSSTFWNIYIIQLLFGMLMLIIYIAYVLLFEINFKDIALIQIMFIISAIFDINWFFFGIEKFKLTVTRNIFIKIICVVLIFLFVKQSSDLVKYTLIMTITTLIGQVWLWVPLRKEISFSKINYETVKENLKPIFILFIPVIAVSLYKMMDKTMLGIMTSTDEVGYYEYAEKITNIPLAVITALGTVMLPRISNVISKGNHEEAKKYIKKSMKFVMFSSFAMMFGLIGIAKEFAPWFFGEEFLKSGDLIIILSITLPMMSFANVIRTQYLIPYEKDKIYVVSVILGAIINLVVNFIMIPFFASLGASIGTVVAEFAVMFYQSMSVRKELKIKEKLIMILPFLIKSLIMFIVVYLEGFLKLNYTLKLIIQIVSGMCVYMLLNIDYIKEVIDIKKLFYKIAK